MNTNITVMESLIVAIISMFVVFLVLILIALLINALKQVSIEDKPETAKNAEIQSTVIDEELIAVISAALATHLDVELNELSIKNIKAVKE